MIRPATRTTLYKEVINQMIELIKTEEWKQGERIPGEIDLARRFEVSRNCVREALKALGHAGVVESKAGLGTFLAGDAVRTMHRMELGKSMQDMFSLAELMDARLIIEPQLAKIAAQRATDTDLARLEAAVDAANRAVKTNQYSVEMGLEFHMLLAQTAGNRVILRLFKSIAEELRLQRGVLILSHLHSRDELVQLSEHGEILAAIKKRDGRRAAELLAAHLKNAARMLARTPPPVEGARRGSGVATEK